MEYTTDSLRALSASGLLADVVVTEGIHGTWYYHLSNKASTHKAACGSQTMICSVPIAMWGHVGHLGERYCSRCVAALSSANASANAPANAPAMPTASERRPLT